MKASVTAAKLTAGDGGLPTALVPCGPIVAGGWGACPPTPAPPSCGNPIGAPLALVGDPDASHGHAAGVAIPPAGPGSDGGVRQSIIPGRGFGQDVERDRPGLSAQLRPVALGGLAAVVPQPAVPHTTVTRTLGRPTHGNEAG